jgi:hypothetical protein
MPGTYDKSKDWRFFLLLRKLFDIKTLRFFY